MTDVTSTFLQGMMPLVKCFMPDRTEPYPRAKRFTSHTVETPLEDLAARVAAYRDAAAAALSMSKRTSQSGYPTDQT